MTSLSRRDILRAGGLLGLAALTGCAKKPAPPAATTIEQVIAGRTPTLQLIPAGTELLSGRAERLAFGVVGKDGLLARGGDVRIWLSETQKTRALGPFTATFRGDGLGDRGVYDTTVTFPKDGAYLALIERTADGATLLGASTVKVGKANTMPKVGEAAVSVHTPTTSDPRGVDPICTAKPPCSMHDRSLADALAAKEKIVVIFATPAFCQSQLCGPEVEMVDAVKGETDGMTFIHVEIYRDDDAATIRSGIVAPAVTAWKVTEEPATYFIDNDGMIVERLLGPLDRSNVRAGVRTLLDA